MRRGKLLNPDPNRAKTLRLRGPASDRVRKGTILDHHSALPNRGRHRQLLWDPPPATVALDDESVHVWCAWLDRPSDEVAALDGNLALDERARAVGYHFSRDRSRFVVRRSLLRAILSSYTGMRPSKIRFDVGRYGKPALRGQRVDRGLDFTVSHSDGLALYAVTRGRPLGVDVERIRPLRDLFDVADRFFSTTERMDLAAVRDDRRVEAFFQCWTRKEAFLKAKGVGLTEPLAGFDVSLTPGEAARILSVHRVPFVASRWSLRHLRPAAGYVAALALEETGLPVSHWCWG